ncbi:hypothetical protein L0U88_11815 [Flavihumibacter sp. RY-1]|uniref:Type I restriction modification DNA specificity protein n=1 Tax=Flavihumibacter fluminis TaxID=2909236 RepID=A0ABS9BJ04_9BACT|nr:hypothetical protein [Flavihumibacter fluminis]MCF1715315.1 hypothetical protein [Flavihumibacter fluminis]
MKVRNGNDNGNGIHNNEPILWQIEPISSKNEPIIAFLSQILKKMSQLSDRMSQTKKLQKFINQLVMNIFEQ